jgi:hypothetical protein
MWTESQYFRGNTFRNVNGGEITDFDVYLGLSAGCVVDFYVLRRLQSGDWNIEAVSSVISPPTTGFINSGNLSPVTMVAGEIYGLGAGWNCSADYYGGTITTTTQTDIGVFQVNIWDDNYPGRSSNYSPPNTGNGDLAYFHGYTVR